MGSAKRHDASVQSADPTRDELDETFEILDRDGAVVVFGGDLMERGFGIVSARTYRRPSSSPCRPDSRRTLSFPYAIPPWSSIAGPRPHPVLYLPRCADA